MKTKSCSYCSQPAFDRKDSNGKRACLERVKFDYCLRPSPPKFKKVVGVPLNCPCPCGSGKQFKRCCSGKF